MDNIAHSMLEASRAAAQELRALLAQADNMLTKQYLGCALRTAEADVAQWQTVAMH